MVGGVGWLNPAKDHSGSLTASSLLDRSGSITEEEAIEKKPSVKRCKRIREYLKPLKKIYSAFAAKFLLQNKYWRRIVCCCNLEPNISEAECSVLSRACIKFGRSPYIATMGDVH